MSVDIYGPGGAAQAYAHVQDVPADTWDVVHSLGFRPNVTVFDSAGSQVEGDLAHVSSAELILTFAGAFAGTAYLS